MRLYCFIHLALGVAVVQSARPAFVGPHPAIRLSTSQLRININKAEDHLQEITQSWSELQAKEKEIEQHPNEEAAMDLVEQMLEKAVEFARTKEEIEEEHIATAHEALMKAIKEEKALEAMALEVAHDAEDSDMILDAFERNHLMEDREKRRELAVSDISHHVEDYVETRIREAKEAEALAKEEEEAASLILEQLKRNEKDLKATLKELRTMKNTKQP